MPSGTYDVYSLIDINCTTYSCKYNYKVQQLQTWKIAHLIAFDHFLSDNIW